MTAQRLDRARRVDQYLAEYQTTRSVAKASLATVGSAVRRFLRDTGGTDITLEAVDAWAEQLPGKQATRQSARITAANFVRWCGAPARKPGPFVAPTGEPLTLEPYVELYLLTRARRGELGDTTLRHRRSELMALARRFGDRPLSTLSLWDVERRMEEVGNLSPAARHQHLCAIRCFTRWLALHGYVPHDVAGTVASVRIPRGLPRALEGPAIEKLLASLPDTRAELIVLLMVQEGLRCSEVSGLQVQEISFIERTMRIVGKGGHTRVLPFTDETWGALVRYLEQHPATHGPLIRSYKRRGAPVGSHSISNYVSEWMQAAGVKSRAGDGISAHACRHTAATDMLRHGAHVKDVQAALGHASMRTTERYLPHLVGDLRDAMNGRWYGGHDNEPLPRPDDA